MMRTILAVVLWLTLCGTVQAAPLVTEDQALAALQQVTTASDKEAACRRLKEIGSTKSVPTLKALLADPNLAQWAVDALQTIPAREAGEALLQALSGTSGKNRALVIFALGTRGEIAAVEPLAKLLSDSDAVVGATAAKALGKIGGDAALAALRAAKPVARGEVRVAVVNSLLAVADGFSAKGQADRANAIYGELHVVSEAPQVRAAAFRGQVLCAGARRADVIAAALAGGEPDEQAMAVQLVRDLPDAGLTSAFGAVLPRLGPLVQVAVLEALRQRSDPAAAAAVAALSRSSDAGVRVAALRALGELGDASHVNLLAELATAGPVNERAEARQALVTLHRGEVTRALLAQIQRGSAPVKIEAAQVLARRMDRGAVPELLRHATVADVKLGVACIQALEKLADDSRMQALFDLIVQAKDGERRDAAVSAFVAAGSRSRRSGDFGALALKALQGASVEGRCALLEAAAQLGGGGVTEALRVAVRDTNADIRAAALRCLSEYAPDEARPDLLKLAQDAKNDGDRALALRGYWRLVEAMTGQSQAERFAAVQAGLAVTSTAADRKLGLARLSELQSREALEASVRYREDAAVRAEAESACLAIASRLEGTDLDAAEKALASLAEGASIERVRNEAKAAVSKLEERKGCVAPWLVSGPYRQAGKEAQQLFDVTFAPEEPQAKAEWRVLAGAGPTMDLLAVAGGDHCIVYLKTRVFCPKEQPVALEIGTDDGVKLWINGAPVHANNAVRGFTAGEDKAKATLKEGWNDILVKVTQHTAGCAASVRIKTAEGKAIPGLRVEAKE